MDVYLIEFIDDHCPEGMYYDLYLNVPNSDIWLTHSGFEDNCMEVAEFTVKFWRENGNTVLITKLGAL